MSVRLDHITLTSGVAITPSDGVTLIVGPNNVGKSAILRGVEQDLAHEPNHPVTPGPVAQVSVSLDAESFLSEREGRYRLVAPGNYQYGSFHQPTYLFEGAQNIPVSEMAGRLSRTNRFGSLANVFLRVMGPEGRGGSLGGQNVPDLMNPGQALNAMQKLWGDRELEAKISEYMRKAFGYPVTVNRNAGINVYLHMGSVDTPAPSLGEKSPYLEEVMKLPQVVEQGSGIQAFMGTLLELAANRYDIVLLDEPETFLHPPQAKLLGEVVAEMSRDGGPQIIVATHSDDFVQGVLNASRDQSDVVIARITRPTSSSNHVAQITRDVVKELYSDPLLRFSNIMDGIFYKGVVLCEAESDCTYYSAVLGNAEEKSGLASSDLLFTQCGGKDRFTKAHAALAAAGVPTAIVADVDVLSNEQKFKDLFTSLGGDFTVLQASYNVLVSSIRNLKVEPVVAEAKMKIEQILTGASGKNLSKDLSDQINAAVRHESGWKLVKRNGKGGVDKGDPTAAFEAIVAACAERGLFIVEVGELERFHPTISGNKQEWLRKVLEDEEYRNSADAEAFLTKILNFIAKSQ